MSYVLAMLLALAMIVSAAVTAIARRLGRAREKPLAPTRHVRLVRMADPSN